MNLQQQEEHLSKTPPGFNGFHGMDRPTSLMSRNTGDNHMGMYGGGTPFSSMSTNNTMSNSSFSMSGMDSRNGMINRNF